MTARLKETYNNEVFKSMMDRFKYENVMEVPKLTKVTINMGLGEAKDNAKVLESAVAEIGLIAGQRPVVTKAKKSIANFKTSRVSAKTHLTEEVTIPWVLKSSLFSLKSTMMM